MSEHQKGVVAQGTSTETPNARVTRRQSLKALAGGAGAALVWPYLSAASLEAFAAVQQRPAARSPVFLSVAQLASVDQLAEAIIPADDRSPGGREARVADYIDLLLSESDSTVQQTWITGLAELDRMAQGRFGSPLATLPSDRLAMLLTEISRNEANPQTPLERFFMATKEATIRGYYSSEIGIQQELRYQGNRMLGEFVGCTHPEHGYKAGV